MMGWNWDAGGWLGMGVGMLFWIGIAVVVMWLVVRSSAEVQRGNTNHPNLPEPDDILRERFARGDIDAEEFERRLALLDGK